MKSEIYKGHKIRFVVLEERVKVMYFDTLVTIYHKNSNKVLYRFYSKNKKEGFERAKAIIKIFLRTGKTPTQIKKDNRMYDSVSGEYQEENW